MNLQEPPGFSNTRSQKLLRMVTSELSNDSSDDDNNNNNNNSNSSSSNSSNRWNHARASLHHAMSFGEGKKGGIDSETLGLAPKQMLSSTTKAQIKQRTNQVLMVRIL